MLKKIVLIIISSIFFSTNSIATVKTSSLTVAKPTLVAKALASECEKMFNVANKLISDAEKQPGTHTQVSKMKNKLSSTKKQLLEMDSTLQTKSCEKGLTALNTLKQNHQ